MNSNHRSTRVSPAAGLTRHLRRLGLAAFALLTACGSDPTGIDLSLDRDGQWQADLQYLVDRLESVHPNLYHAVSRSTFGAARARLAAQIPALSEDQIFVELLRLVALAGSERDGHMALSYFVGTGNRIVPLQFYRFADGVHVVRANGGHEALVGRRLVGIGTHSLDEVNQLIDPLIPRDNEQSLIGFRNLTYITPTILETLGVVESGEMPAYRFADDSGADESVVVGSVRPEQYGMEFSYHLPTSANSPLYLTRRSETFWLTHLQPEKTLYIRLNQLRGSSGATSLQDLAEEAQQIIAGNELDRTVLDLRQNDGGDNGHVAGIVDFLRTPGVDRPGRLFVLTDRNTFSATGNLVAAIAESTGAIFVGTPPGGSGSQYGDAERYDLPYSGIAAFIPTRHWVFGASGAQFLSHPMDVELDPTAAEFFANEDPVLDHVLGSGE